jgi:hypothetical protein
MSPGPAASPGGAFRVGRAASDRLFCPAALLPSHLGALCSQQTHSALRGSRCKQFVTGVLQKIENMHFPGLQPSGRQSGGLSPENINRMRGDFQRGTTGHLEKFQNSLRGLVNAYNESYEAQTSPEQGNRIRSTLRGEYDQALQNAGQTGFSESAVLNSDRGTLPSSLPSEAQSTFNRISGEPAAGADGATSGTEEAPAEGAGEIPPKSY